MKPTRPQTSRHSTAMLKMYTQYSPSLVHGNDVQVLSYTMAPFGSRLRVTASTNTRQSGTCLVSTPMNHRDGHATALPLWQFSGVPKVQQHAKGVAEPNTYLTGWHIPPIWQMVKPQPEGMIDPYAPFVAIRRRNPTSIPHALTPHWWKPDKW